MKTEMINVLMDGIKDTNMLLDYMAKAETQEQKNWFFNHAKTRADQAVTDYAYICQQLGLKEKANNGDEIAGVFYDHLASEIDNIKNRVAAVSR